MTKLLKVGEKSTFKTYDNRVIIGKVHAIHANCYLVIGDSICNTYSDGLYRFTDSEIVRN